MSSGMLRATHYRTGEVYEFEFRAGRVSGGRRLRSRQRPAVLFGPGLVDLQCNGFAGVDYNSPETSLEEIQRSVEAMWRHGCTVVLPTVITASRDRLVHLFEKLVEATGDREMARSAPGFHLEGPFISPEEGARGAHPRADVRPPDLRFWRATQKAAEGRIALLTLAPEVRGAMSLITALRAEQVLPAIGHTLATTAQVAAAADAGAMMSTHLGNGCPQQIPRHANPIFAQLGEDRLAASVIPDGIHLPPEVVRTIARVKGPERTVLVTDAMAAAAAPAGRYRLGELTLEVGEDRVVRQPGSPNLAGSAVTLDAAVLNFARMTGATLADAWYAASLLPIKLLREAGMLRRIDPGVIFAAANDQEFRVVAACRGKRVLWAAENEIDDGSNDER